jgi:hypothetical protein
MTVDRAADGADRVPIGRIRIAALREEVSCKMLCHTSLQIATEE